MSSTNSRPQRDIRLATPADFEELVDVALRAFIHDPVFNYFGTVKKILSFDDEKDTKALEHRRLIFKFLMQACHPVGGRITVVVECNDGSTKEKILAGCLWLPPHVRLAVWMLPTVIRSGMIPVLKGWGLNGFKRIALEWQPKTEKKTKECFKFAKCKKSVEDAWYLQLAFTNPEHQGQGLLSLLLREAFANAPDAIFTLEATTAKSRDRYAHFGFTHPVSIILGKGKADTRGVVASGADAVGVECWAMVKWPTPTSVPNA